MFQWNNVAGNSECGSMLGLVETGIWCQEVGSIRERANCGLFTASHMLGYITDHDERPPFRGWLGSAAFQVLSL